MSAPSPLPPVHATPPPTRTRVQLLLQKVGNFIYSRCLHGSVALLTQAQRSFVSYGTAKDGSIPSVQYKLHLISGIKKSIRETVADLRLLQDHDQFKELTSRLLQVLVAGVPEDGDFEKAKQQFVDRIRRERKEEAKKKPKRTEGSRELTDEMAADFRRIERENKNKTTDGQSSDPPPDEPSELETETTDYFSSFVPTEN